MNRQTAEKIVQQFDFKTMEVLETWIDYRISQLRFITESLLSAPDQIRFAQGAIDELRVLKKIRDTSLLILEQG
jgi:hypothetical protein